MVLARLANAPKLRPAGLHICAVLVVVLETARLGQCPGFDPLNGTNYLLVVRESQSSRKQTALLVGQ